MIHAKLVQPRVFPWNNDITPAQIDRAQDIGGDLTLNQEKLYEIGRDGKLGTRKQTPSLAYSMKQYEFGSMDFFYALANKEAPGSGESHYITLDDLKTTKFDITAYLTDDDTTFKGTLWFPKLRVNGFSIDIGDPDAAVMRNFDLIGEDFKILDGKYFAYQKGTAVGATLNMVLSPAPVAYASGEYIFRVLRVRSGVVTELVETTDYTYTHGTTTLAILSTQVGDVIKAYYESSTAYTTLWTDNDSDLDALYADSCDIYLKVGAGTKIYRLQSVNIAVSFERTDYKEIGNTEVVQTGVKSKTVTVALNRYNEGFSLEDILASDTAYPYINPRNFSDSIQLMVKIYSDSTKTTFKMGYLITGLSPTALSTSQTIEDYNQMNDTLEADNLKISDEESEIVFS